LLITFLLTERRILNKPVLYLSHYFKAHRAEYYERLQAIRDRGAFEAWLEFFLCGVEKVSNEAVETSRRILSMREEHRERVTMEFGRAAAHGHRVLESLYRHPILSVRSVQAVTGTSFRAANQLVARFVSHGILREITGNARNRKFRYEPYVSLFS
jgi:Fic family protein